MDILKNEIIHIYNKDDNYIIEIKNIPYVKRYMNYLLLNDTDMAYNLEEYMISYEKVLHTEDDTEVEPDNVKHIHKFIFSDNVKFTGVQKWKKTRKNKLHYDEVEQYMKDIGLFMNFYEINERKSVTHISLSHIIVMEIKDEVKDKYNIRFIPFMLDENIRYYDIHSKGVLVVPGVFETLEKTNFFGLNVNKRFMTFEEPIMDKHKAKHFSSKELREIYKREKEEFPVETTCTNWVYSLGLTAIYLLTYNKSIVKDELTREEIAVLIEDILHTPLYSCLSRCLEDDYKIRVFMYL